jgi:hypothetical protein
MAWQLAGSAAAVAVLVVLAWRLGFSGSPELAGEAHARSLAEEVPGGFEAIAVGLDQSRRAALLRDASGGIVLIAPAGAHFVARRLGRGSKAVREDGRLTVSGSGASARLDLGQEADDWAKAIARLG